MFVAYLESPIGKIKIGATEKGVCELIMQDDQQLVEAKENEYTMACKMQLKEYFEGKRTIFDLTLDVQAGTVFQRSCWDALCTIPYGETASYKDIAEKIGNPKAMRAVGGANHRNPTSIIVP